RTAATRSTAWTRRVRRPRSSSIRRRWSVSSPPGPEARDERVWDPLLRVLHWTLVVTVVLAWATTIGSGRYHEAAGYVALGCVALRAAWGFVGPAHARFANFVRGPRSTLAYAALLVQGREPRYLGHNPLGGW